MRPRTLHQLLDDTHARLAHRVGELATELDRACARLERETARLEQATFTDDDGLGTIAAEIAAEIRHPDQGLLVTIDRALAASSRSEGADSVRRSLEKVLAEVRRCGRIVEILLPDSGGTTVH